MISWEASMQNNKESRWKYVWPWLGMAAVIGALAAFAWE
jgi:hypothetical protein